MVDNEQIVGKTWNIKPQNKVNVSVITNVAAAQLTQETAYENRADLHPAQWYTKERVYEVMDSIVNQDGAEYKELEKEHLKQLTLYVEAAVQQDLLDCLPRPPRPLPRPLAAICFSSYSKTIQHNYQHHSTSVINNIVLGNSVGKGIVPLH